MNEQMVMTATECAEQVLRLLRKEATAGLLAAREAGISEPIHHQLRASSSMTKRYEISLFKVFPLF